MKFLVFVFIKELVENKDFPRIYKESLLSVLISISLAPLVV